MDKLQALYQFWSSFGIPAYEETSVPDEAKLPYITYEVSVSSFDEPIPLSASVWTTNLADLSRKTDEISEHISKMNPPTIPIDGGRLRIVKRQPFGQEMSDDTNRKKKRMVLGITVEYETNY